MNNNTYDELLIDYAEGTLPTERRKEIEALLASSPAFRSELVALQLAFQTLQNVPQEEVPPHFFNQILPGVRRKLAEGKTASFWTIPRLFVPMIRPITTLLVVAAVAGLYRSLEPEETVSPLYSVVRSVEQKDIVSLIDQSSTIVSISSESIFDGALDMDSFGIDLARYNSESDILAFVEESDLDNVVETMIKKELQ